MKSNVYQKNIDKFDKNIEKFKEFKFNRDEFKQIQLIDTFFRAPENRHRQYLYRLIY